MDPIGFAFENFDGIGRWREKDNHAAIDPAGALPDGRSFDGAAGLVKLLADDKERFIRNLAEQMLTYALGRGPEYYDQCAIEKVYKDVAGNGDRFSAMVTAIATSDPFRKRRAKGNDE
jgi:hypothetical protein